MTISHALNIHTLLTSIFSNHVLCSTYLCFTIYYIFYYLLHVSEFMKSFQNVFSIFIYFDVNYGIFKRLNNILLCLSEWISSSIHHIQAFKCFLYVDCNEHTTMAVELFMIFRDTIFISFRCISRRGTYDISFLSLQKLFLLFP